MGPITPIDSGTTTRVSAVAAVRGVQAVSATDTTSRGTGREEGTVTLSSRGAASASRERQARQTGDVEIDRQLAASSEAAVRTVTYSFYDNAVPAGDAQAQQARSVADRQRVREALNYYASVANVQFVEVGAGGDVQYGVTPAPTAAEIRAARTEAEIEVAAAKAQLAADEAAPPPRDAAAPGVATAQTDDLVGLNLDNRPGGSPPKTA